MGWDLAGGVSRLGPDDAGEVLTLQLAAWVREAHANDTLAIPPLHETLADVREQLADPVFDVWGFRPEGRLLATVRTRLRADPAVAFVGRLGVVPDLYRQGLGGAMLRYAEGRLPRSVRRIELVTGIRSFGNHAFYERAGYVIVRSEPAAGIVHLVKELPAGGER